MTIAIITILAFFLLCCLLLLSTMCRTGHPGLEQLRGWAYAHRGLHCDAAPENSMEAFRRAKKAGCGAELDVHLMADGNLAVFHDSSLQRMTGKNGIIENLTAEQLSDYKLAGTDESIPQLRQVLELISGEVPLIIELKSGRNNHRALCSKVCEMLDGYEGAFCLESFDPRCIRWLRKNRPDLIRGQLAENFFAAPGSRVPWIGKLILGQYMLNFLTRPDFVAYRFSDNRQVGVWLCRRFWKAQPVAWTLRSREEYDQAVKMGWIPIFENFEISA